MNVRIRNARIDDTDAMTALLGELFSIEADFDKDERRQRRGLKLLLEGTTGDRHCIKVAEVNGEVVGMCSIQKLISTAEGRMVGLVEDMVVTSSLRGLGIGRFLIKQMEKWAIEHKLVRLQLLADRSNFPALDFYSAMGWEPTRLIGVRRTWSR